MIAWVMGGTAVGKKTLMKRAVADPARYRMPADVRRCWLADGDMSLGDLVHAATGKHLVVRWQWGREDRIREMEAIHSRWDQRIYLVETDLEVQFRRAVNREGFAKFGEDSLRDEARDVRLLVKKLSEELRMPVYHVDGN